MDRQQDINRVVNTEVTRVKNKSDEIQAAMSEQKVAVSEIVKSIVNVNEITQAYAEGSEKLSNNAKRVEEMTDELRKTVDAYDIESG